MGLSLLSRLDIVQVKTGFTMELIVALVLFICLSSTGAEPQKRSLISECLHDCDDLPRGQRAPCRADCIRGYDLDDCLMDCEKYPPGTAQKNCITHCNIFGNRNTKKGWLEDCLDDCKKNPWGQPGRGTCIGFCFNNKATMDCLHNCRSVPKEELPACRRACVTRFPFASAFNMDDCLDECAHYPEGPARDDCETFCDIFGGGD